MIFMQEFLINTLQSLLEQLYSVRKAAAANKPVAAETSTACEHAGLPVEAMEEKETILDDHDILNRLEDKGKDGSVDLCGSSPVMKSNNEQEGHRSLPHSEYDSLSPRQPGETCFFPWDGTDGAGSLRGRVLEADITSEVLEEMEKERIISEEESNVMSSEEEEQPVEVEGGDLVSGVEVRTPEPCQATLSQWSRGVNCGISKQVELFFIGSCYMHAWHHTFITTLSYSQ